MKKLLLLFIAVIPIFTVVQAKAEGLTKISTSVFKSTFIYFNDQVISIDVGLNNSYDATFEKNYVRLTAIQQKADYTTNLTVVTKSGIYGFLVDYKEQPEKLYYFPEDFTALRSFSSSPTVQSTPQAMNFQNTGVNQEVDDLCRLIATKKMDYPVAAFSKADVFFSVDKIYVRDDKFYIKVVANNESNIDFDVDFIKFHIKNKRKMKRSSLQEVYKQPLYCHNKITKLLANTKQTTVFVLDKFTIMKKKQFLVEVEEKGGERNMSFQINHKDILNAVEI